ncbi:hypothetical protein TNCV_1594711 [Trichonephila clavipes]|nr:hypothetical protein TNCV_1594711 [Trichonephila clavipes]
MLPESHRCREKVRASQPSRQPSVAFKTQLFLRFASLRCFTFLERGVSSRPKLTGIERGKAFLHVLRRRPIVAQTHANVPYNARCDGYDRKRH